MLGFDEARARLLGSVRRVSIERAPLGESAGRVLGEDLVARDPLPAFDHSAMDGYAIATADLGADGPFALPVVGESRAGREVPPLLRSTACRIFTGAPLPARADAVIMQENARRDGDDKIGRAHV